jgi:putative PIN family toxin of toxin-antitoxin system
MATDRWRVFLDTNVFIAGLASRTGASAAILDLGEAEEILIVVSRQVLVEADRVFLAKFPHLIERYRLFIRNLAPHLVDDPPRALVNAAARVIHSNDAPILAAAKAERPDYLVTLNTRHFATPQARAFVSHPILTPAEFLTAFRNFWERSASA